MSRIDRYIDDALCDQLGLDRSLPRDERALLWFAVLIRLIAITVSGTVVWYVYKHLTGWIGL